MQTLASRTAVAPRQHGVVLAPSVMVQGTASSVGKSLLVTALCRLFHQEGIRVAPFKAQNMALNSFVTADGREIGRAQAVQAEAAGIAPTVEMNPILLKPEGDMHAQVVVLGKPIGSLTAQEYATRQRDLQRVIADSLRQLRQNYELIVIEGAGSPAEINLKSRDLVNMHVAQLADAPVLLVGDIDRGGVFAAFVGTLELLDANERSRIAGLVINKFRGDKALLDPGLSWLTERTGLPVFGVLPYLPHLRVAEEDSVALDTPQPQRPAKDDIDIVVVRLPHISNYDDFDPLAHEPGAVVRFVEAADDVRDADVVILPGSKCTVRDLAWVRERGVASAIAQRAAQGKPVLGICGGCQMLGEEILDPYGVESSESRVSGLGLLPVRTRFERDKVTAQVRARVQSPSLLTRDLSPEQELSGYEIHMGVLELTRPAAQPFVIVSRSGRAVHEPDGACSGAVIGTLVHGLFENEPVRTTLLAALRYRKDIAAPAARGIPSRDAEYDRLAVMLREHLDCELLYRIARVRSEVS